MWASQNGFIAVVKYLLDHGANKAALNNSGNDAFSLAGIEIVADLRNLLKK
jgi:ankyrin repeat protein